MMGWEGLYGRPRGGGNRIPQESSERNRTRATDNDGLFLA